MKGNADNVAVENHGLANEALNVEDRLSPVQLDPTTDEHQAIARANRGAEAHVLHADETDKVHVFDDAVANDVISAHLRGRLAHQNTRQKWIARHVAADPEFVSTHILVAGEDVLDRVNMHDGVELFHFEA